MTQCPGALIDHDLPGIIWQQRSQPRNCHYVNTGKLFEGEEIVITTPQCLIVNISVLVLIMIWHRTNHKLIPEAMMSQFIGTYIHHKDLMGQQCRYFHTFCMHSQYEIENISEATKFEWAALILFKDLHKWQTHLAWFKCQVQLLGKYQ